MKCVVVFCLVFACVTCSRTSESNGTAEELVDGLTLVELGRETHKPLLTLIGVAIRNLHPCELWSSWTPCEVTAKGYFGTRTRVRSCVHTRSMETTEINKQYNETDIGVCEGRCRPDANLTSHGFCLKLHLTTLNNDDAEKVCEQEEGYLINIDSEAKYQDVISMLKDYSSGVNIGGRRVTASSPWTYKYGSQTPFIKWGSGEPDNGSNDLCLTYASSEKIWYDSSCTTNRPFLCEYPQH